MPAIEIVNLSSRSYFAKVCGQWSFSEWGQYLPQDFEVTLNKTIDGYIARTKTDSIPQTWIAVQNDDCVGMVSLKDKELDQFDKITPWVGSLYVDERFRGQGLGKSLMDKVEEMAKSYGFNALHLFSSKAEDYYTQHQKGWNIVERFLDPRDRKEKPLMRKTL